MILRLALMGFAAALLLSGCGRNAKNGGDAVPVSAVAVRPAESSAAPAGSAADPVREQCNAEVLDILKSLRGPMTVTAYMNASTSNVDRFITSLRSVLLRYEKAGKGRLKVVLVEPTTVTTGYLGLVFDYGSEKVSITLLSSDQGQGFEFWIASKMRELRDRAHGRVTRVGVIAKEGIKISDASLVPPRAGQPSPTIKRVVAQALPFYKLEEVDLKGGDATIDGALRGVIVLQADGDWTDKELGRIDQFLMRGDKSLLVMAGAVNMKAADATMKVSLSTRRLERLLDGYGIEMKKEAIVDSGSQLRIPVPGEERQWLWMIAPGAIKLKHDADAEEAKQTLDNGFAGFFQLDELAFPYPSVLIPHPEKQPGATITVVARSSATSTLEPSATIDPKPQTNWKATGKAGQHAIAVAVEGKLRSAFGDQSPGGMEIGQESVKPSRVLVIASPQFLANPFVRAGNPRPVVPQITASGFPAGEKALPMFSLAYARKHVPTTILAFKNLLAWMAGDERLIACSALLVAPPSKDEVTETARPAK